MAIKKKGGEKRKLLMGGEHKSKPYFFFFERKGGGRGRIGRERGCEKETAPSVSVDKVLNTCIEAYVRLITQITTRMC